MESLLKDLAAALDEQRIAEIVVDDGARLFGASSAVLWTAEESGLRLARSFGEPGPAAGQRPTKHARLELEGAPVGELVLEWREASAADAVEGHPLAVLAAHASMALGRARAFAAERVARRIAEEEARAAHAAASFAASAREAPFRVCA